jgi:hypothetical protein
MALGATRRIFGMDAPKHAGERILSLLFLGVVISEAQP